MARVSGGEDLDGCDEGFDDTVTEQDGDQQPGDDQPDLLVGRFRLGGVHFALLVASAVLPVVPLVVMDFSWNRSATGRISRLAMKPTASTPTMVNSAGRYAAAVSVPGLPSRSRKPLMISGPAMPAADHAVSSRPWIAPTW